MCVSCLSPFLQFFLPLPPLPPAVPFPSFCAPPPSSFPTHHPFHPSHEGQHCNSMSESGSVCVTITNPPRPNITDDERKSLRCSWDTSSFDFYEWTFNGSHLSLGRFNLGQTHNDLTIQGSPQTHGEYRCVVARKGNTGDREIAKLFIYYFRKCVCVCVCVCVRVCVYVSMCVHVCLSVTHIGKLWLCENSAVNSPAVYSHPHSHCHTNAHTDAHTHTHTC